MYHGLIILDKEAGFTSHDAVAKLRGICGQKKIGHTGTLDPAALGVLPVCLGNATKLCGMITDWDKEYVADLLLGVRTDTQDATGQVLERREVDLPADRVEQAVLSFQGPYLQVPPMYSALKKDGKRLYELARAGKEVERAARPVEIKEIEILEMDLPRVRLRVACSKGTYIRTLCDDIGRLLGVGGIMEGLLRTRVGKFGLAEAITLSQAQALKEEGRLAQALIPTDACFQEYPALHVRREFSSLLYNGNAFSPGQALEGGKPEAGRWVRVYDEDGRFCAVYEYEPSLARFRPVKMFLT